MSRFQSYRVPDTSVVDVEALSVGFGIGAVIGTLFPLLAFVAEIGLGTPLVELVTHPSAALLVTVFVPAGLGLTMAVAYHMASTWRSAYQSVAGKASQLMEENWDLMGQESQQPVVEPVDVPAPTSLDGSVAEALVSAQVDVLCSVGEATQDVARRMHVNIKGLTMTDLSQSQGRMVDALAGHVEGLWDLADDVVTYSEESKDRTPPPTAPRRRDVRSAKPARPPGRLAA
ncbi:MAG: hypothetical protein ACI9MC_001821 [Kiritimatiellia bacterium]|jgi:hypothetical protein